MSTDEPTTNAEPEVAKIHEEISLAALLWLPCSGTMWVVAVFGWGMVLSGVAALFVPMPALRLGMEPVDTPWRVLRWLSQTLPVAGFGTLFVWLRLTGRVPPAWPRPPENRPGPVGLRRLPWYFVAFPVALGEIRAALTGMLRLMAIVFLVWSPAVWWTNRTYEHEGLRTSDVVALRRFIETRGETKFRVVELRYHDAGGRPHTGLANFPVKGHANPYSQLPKEVDPETLRSGDRLPPIEYLRSRPERFRFAGSAVAWWQMLGMALGAWSLSAFLVWTTDWFPAEARIDGGGP